MPETKNSSPFTRRRTTCPACHKRYDQRYFRLRMYVPDQRESDQHVLSYTWRDKNVKRVHPPFYFVMYCPECYFAETSRHFPDPARSEFGRWLLKSFRQPKPDQATIVELLGSHIDYEEIGYYSALNLHLLALYEQLLPPEDLRDFFKIGQLLLRTGWLYRERANKTPDVVDTIDDEKAFFRFSSYAEFMQELKTRWDFVPTDESDAVCKAVAYFRKAVSLDSRFDSTGAYMSALSLIIDLSVRINDLDGAFETIRGIYAAATEDRQKLMEQMNAPGVTPQQKRRLETQVKRVSDSLDNAIELRQNLMDSVLEKMMPRIRKIAQAKRGAAPEDLETSLVEAGLSKAIVAHLKKKVGSLDKIGELA